MPKYCTCTGTQYTSTLVCVMHCQFMSHSHCTIHTPTGKVAKHDYAGLHHRYTNEGERGVTPVLYSQRGRVTRCSDRIRALRAHVSVNCVREHRCIRGAVPLAVRCTTLFKARDCAEASAWACSDMHPGGGQLGEIEIGRQKRHEAIAWARTVVAAHRSSD